MARPVNLHGRPLDRCTIFGSVPQRNARIMNPKNPDLDLDLDVSTRSVDSSDH